MFCFDREAIGESDDARRMSPRPCARMETHCRPETARPAAARTAHGQPARGKGLTNNFSVRSAALALLVLACPAQSQAQAFALREPIPFHGARLVGFQRGVGLKTGTGVVRPSDPTLVFITIKLELGSPFEYVRGRFREITLTDEGGSVYGYRGWLTDEGWLQIDDTDGPANDMGLMEASEYPAILDLHFEVPAAVRSLTLHYGAASATLFQR
jgi:hypothetical protein